MVVNVMLLCSEGFVFVPLVNSFNKRSSHWLSY